MIYTSIILIVLVSMLLLKNHWSKNKGVIFLIFAIVFGSIRSLTFFLIFNPVDICALTTLYIQTDPLSCMIGPSFYFYYRSLVIEKRTFSGYNLLHLFPALLVAINTIPLYLLPLEEKVKTLSFILTSTTVSTTVLPHLLFSFRFQQILPSIISIAYFMYVFYRVKAKRDLQFYISKNTPKVINRIVFLFAINLIPSIFLVLFAILNSTLKSNNWLIVFSEFSY
jgi:hypothetical protein